MHSPISLTRGAPEVEPRREDDLALDRPTTEPSHNDHDSDDVRMDDHHHDQPNSDQDSRPDRRDRDRPAVGPHASRSRSRSPRRDRSRSRSWSRSPRASRSRSRSRSPRNGQSSLRSRPSATWSLSGGPAASTPTPTTTTAAVPPRRPAGTTTRAPRTTLGKSRLFGVLTSTLRQAKAEVTSMSDTFAKRTQILSTVQSKLARESAAVADMHASKLQRARDEALIARGVPEPKDDDYLQTRARNAILWRPTRHSDVTRIALERQVADRIRVRGMLERGELTGADAAEGDVRMAESGEQDLRGERTPSPLLGGPLDESRPEVLYAGL
ncbi:hypothetical protein AMAG_16700 [Allomyces macrogynus ATCC 38327]|uniref:Pinin/SDK/MemA protein domain-containing protein n=1 Tax=Allomyces macrogynus (strain ATCC 38327) TaxID=578462 RepID=A0A0L0TBT2_ALLM3|nr:hypothetical protein AMAG_16700 [Allomyces macrogynus ATCC 38327]|eukprot:KNE72217.1 hypothetical protein AMAG_16700 [Allomyces macrogynus ATCC 38327]